MQLIDQAAAAAADADADILISPASSPHPGIFRYWAIEDGLHRN
jgi:hypothetical protein